MAFVAQINLSEFNASLLDLPDSGVLQFYIAMDDLTGLSFFQSTAELDSMIAGDQQGYRVIYHAALDDHDETFFEQNALTVSDESPVRGACALNFSVTQDQATPADYRWEKEVQSLAPLLELHCKAGTRADMTAQERTGQERIKSDKTIEGPTRHCHRRYAELL